MWKSIGAVSLLFSLKKENCCCGMEWNIMRHCVLRGLTFTMTRTRGKLVVAILHDKRVRYIYYRVYSFKCILLHASLTCSRNFNLKDSWLTYSADQKSKLNRHQSLPVRLVVKLIKSNDDNRFWLLCA